MVFGTTFLRFLLFLIASYFDIFLYIYRLSVYLCIYLSNFVCVRACVRAFNELQKYITDAKKKLHGEICDGRM